MKKNTNVWFINVELDSDSGIDLNSDLNLDLKEE